MHLIERAEHMRELAAMYTEVERGRGRAALITGATGIGKTRLLDAAAAHAERHGARVLLAFAAPAERDRPFAVLEQLLRQAPLDPETRGRVAELVGTADSGPTGGSGADRADPSGWADLPDRADPSGWADLSGWSDPSGWADRVDRTGREFGRILLRALDRGPVLLGVDDVQDADAESLRVLVNLAPRLQRTPLFLLLTRNGHVDSIRNHELLELLHRFDFQRLQLAALSRQGVAELLARAPGGRPADEATARHCHAVSGGNPLLVLGLAGDRAATTPDGRPADVPGPAFREAVLFALHRMPSEIRSAAQRMAVLGPVTAALAEREDADPSCRYAAERLTAVGLLDRHHRFRHAAVRETVLATVPTARRVGIHHYAARVLYEAGRPATDVAEHLVDSDGPFPAWAVDTLQGAAEHLLACGDVETAAAHLRLARRLADEPERRAVVGALLAQADWQLRPAAAARGTAGVLASMRAGELPRRHLGTLGRLLFRQGLPDEGAEALLALADPAARSDFADASELAFSLRWLSTSFPGEFRALPEDVRALAAPTAAPADPAAPAVEPRRAVDLLHAVLTRRATDEDLRRVERVVSGRRLTPATVEPVLDWLAAAVYTERLDLAAAECEDLLRQAEARKVPHWQAVLAGWRAEIAQRRGEPAAVVERHARTALTRMPERAWGAGIAGPISALVLAAAGRGDHETAADLLGRPLPRGLFRSRHGLRYLHARGHAQLAAGRPLAAVADFTSCRRLMTEWDLDLPALVPWRTDLAQALLRLDRQAEARALAQEQLDLVRCTSGATHGMTLRHLAAATESPARQVVLLKRSARLLQACGHPRESALTMFALSRAYVELGEAQQARTAARRTQSLLEQERPARVPAPRVRPDADPVGCPPPRAGEPACGEEPARTEERLSEAEQRVAQLASRGCTNREIADLLHITVSTVEQHLTRVYRKLGVARRTKLADRLRELSLEAA
ncbi:AAA family ATPase [Kitasatospora phosalacinea]|uniref:helix-turn-helix transcriptional regulator n=1 Tax=Kitasatospora phosalacinea TaxID=2065 RepID=UPI0035DD59C9